MSGQVIGSIVGTVAGSFFGPVGAAIGGAIGGAIGSSFDTLPTQYGPRLEDLRPQTSEYGKPIPIVFGTVGMGGNVIWASDYVEVETETEQGGKGGPSQTSVTYSYYANFAVAFAEGPNTIGRMWAGPSKRLIYDGVLLEGGGTVRIYEGTESQLPDPLIESYEGVGNVPAHRGVTYVVFEMFPLAEDGNAIPFITAEVGAKAGAHGQTPTSLGEAAPSDPFAPAIAAVDPTTGLIWSMARQFDGNTLEVRVNSDETMEQVQSFSYQLPTVHWNVGCGFVGSDSNSYTISNLIPVRGGMLAVGDSFDSWLDIFVFFPSDLSPPSFGNAYHREACPGNGVIYRVDNSHGTAAVHEAFQDPLTGDYVLLRYGGMVGLVNPVDAQEPFYAPSVNNYYLGESPGSLGTVWIDKVILTPTYYAAFCYGDHDVVVLRALGSHEFYAQIPIPDISGANGDAFYDSDRDRFIIVHGSGTFDIPFTIVDVATATASQHAFSPSADADTDPTPTYKAVTGVYHMGKYIIGANGGGGTGTTLYVINPDTLTTEGTYTYEPSSPGQLKAPLLAPDENKPYVISFDNGSIKRLSIGGAVVATPMNLGAIVADLSLRAGLSAEQVDVSALTDMVDGYAIARQTTVRAAIDALRPAYYFDAVESGGKVKYVKRGGRAAAVIDDNDLDAHQADGQPGDPLLTTRQMEVELPKTCNVNYLLAATDYEKATQTYSRQIGSSEEETTLDLPLVLTDTKGQEVAQVNTHAAWVQRIKYGPFTLPRKYSALEPSDIITIRGYEMMLEKVTASPGGVLTCEAVATDSSHYTPHVVVTETVPTEKLVYIPGDTVLELM